ncbi:hypothetical protein T09_3427 [Trichinella sp. T9]|nr:hypothetical protein T09_3427 [Trichinella sp. T9]
MQSPRRNPPINTPTLNACQKLLGIQAILCQLKENCKMSWAIDLLLRELGDWETRGYVFCTPLHVTD